MSASFARQVAEAILNEAQSGSAVWDELGGPSAVLAQAGEDTYVITGLIGYDDESSQAGPACRIIIEGGCPS